MAFIGLIISLLCINPVRPYEYCLNEKKFCPKPNDRHIACFPEQLNSSVKMTIKDRYTITKKLRNLILDLHNSYRSAIACGGGNVTDVDGTDYPAAARMQKLSWDYELEYIAGLHNARCMIKRDLCRATERFPLSGQSLGYFWSSACGIKTVRVCKNMVTSFYNEHMYAQVKTNIIDASSFKNVSRFTLLVNDNVDKVGCALIACYQLLDFDTEVRKKYTYLLTCNYSYDNVKRKPTYIDGTVGSKCGNFNKTLEANTCLCV